MDALITRFQLQKFRLMSVTKGFQMISHEASKVDSNREIVLAFYKLAVLEGKVDEAIELYAGPSYTQHTPLAADGFDGLRAYVRWIAETSNNPQCDIKGVFADGDRVLIHCHWTGLFTPHGDAVMEMFRVENSKVVEHWDVIQPIPETSLNSNTMF